MRGGGYSEENRAAAAVMGGLFALVGVLMLVVDIRGQNTSD